VEVFSLCISYAVGKQANAAADDAREGSNGGFVPCEGPFTLGGGRGVVIVCETGIGVV